jgi:hypothetical protein
MWVPKNPNSRLAQVNFGSTATHPFNTVEILKRQHLISNERMRAMVVKGLTKHWDSHYEGPRDIFRDDSVELDKEVEQKIFESIMKEEQAGWTVGPFGNIPFPNSWCPSQALVTRLFAIPKHKWHPENPEIRVVTHFSHPRGNSVNDWTGRWIHGVWYYTVQMFLSKVARAGKGALVSLVDVKHAYRNLLLNPADWHHQVVRVFGLYYVQLRGLFGSVTAGDNWIVFVSAIVEITRKVLKLGGWTCKESVGEGGLDVYVDNFDNVVPGVNGQPDYERGRVEHGKIMRLLGEVFGLPLHEEHKPSTEIEAHLGWRVDTMRQMVGTTEERREMMLGLLLEWAGRQFYSKKQLDSLIGIVGFVACVVPGLQPPLTHLRECGHKNFPHHRTGRVCKRLRNTCLWTHDFLTRWKGETRLYDMDWSDGHTVLLRTDASVAPFQGKSGGGCGAWTAELGTYLAWVVTPEVLEQAMRLVKHSVPYLELWCIVVTLHTQRSALAGHRVMVYSDSRTAVLASQKRFSKNKHMLRLLHRMDRDAAVGGYSLRFSAIGRDLNEDADHLAKSWRCPDSVAPFVQDMEKRYETSFSRITPVRPPPLNL